jgi:hypothetical protein
MVSAISIRGDMHWMVYQESMNSALFTACLGYLIHDIEGKIFLIADRVRYHTSNETAEWLDEHKDRIELFFLPSYSPDMNLTNGSGRTLSMTAYTASSRRSQGSFSPSPAGRSVRSGELLKRSGDSSPIPISPTSTGPTPRRGISSGNLVVN